MTKEGQSREPIFVSEREFRENPRRYIEQATTLQKVAVFDSKNAIVVSMGGRYTVPE